MANRTANKLSARTVGALTAPGRYPDGQNLYLVIAQAGTKRWAFIYTRQGRQHEHGLGSTQTTTLAQARQKAQDCRALLNQNRDPIQARQTPPGQSITRPTFAHCAQAFIESKRPQWRSSKNINQWRSVLLGPPCQAIHNRFIDEIETSSILQVLQPILTRTPATAARLRGRLENVLDYATAHGYRTGPNPAAWKNHLALILPRRPQLPPKHHPAMAYTDIPIFMRRMQANPEIAAKALQFCILTAARAGEVFNAVWAEVDFNQAIWAIPAEKMKNGNPHRVPLSTPAIGILATMRQFCTSTFIFPGHSGRKAMSNGMMRKFLPSHTTVHGFRASFRDFCAERTDFPREICEAALAHTVGNSAERAYKRTDLLERRRVLMAIWAELSTPERFCSGWPE